MTRQLKGKLRHSQSATLFLEKKVLLCAVLLNYIYFTFYMDRPIWDQIVNGENDMVKHLKSFWI